METVMKTAGIALIALACSFILKEKHRFVGVLCSGAAIILIESAVFDTSLSKTVSQIFMLVEGTSFSGYAKIMLKSLGIAYIVNITESICKEAGENSVGEAVVLAGKAEILFLCLPLIASLLDIAKALV